jgi:hypothetical protein
LAAEVEGTSDSTSLLIERSSARQSRGWALCGKATAEARERVFSCTPTRAVQWVRSRGTETEFEPIGQSPADLSWVSRTIAMSGKRLVLEDFHYLSEAAQKDLAFLLKAMGEYMASS